MKHLFGKGLCEYRKSKMRRTEAKNGFLFILPWLIGFFGFTLYPIASSLYYSFCDYSVIKEPVFVGMKNYLNLLNDATFLKACKNTGYMILLGVDQRQDLRAGTAGGTPAGSERDSKEISDFPG